MSAIGELRSNGSRRRRLVVALGGIALLTSGCASKPPSPVNEDGTYCFRVGRRLNRSSTCTSQPIPGKDAQTAALAFGGAPGRLTIYIVRKRWADSKNVVRVSVEGDSSVDTIPESFARLRTSPGKHQLHLRWADGSSNLDVTGAAGEVVFVEVVGSVWVWGSTYRLERGDPVASRDRAARLRLVADAG